MISQRARALPALSPPHGKKSPFSPENKGCVTCNHLTSRQFYCHIFLSRKYCGDGVKSSTKTPAMKHSLTDDGQGIFSLCLLVLFSSVALWLVVSLLFSWLTRRGEERIRHMERMEQKLSARVR